MDLSMEQDLFVREGSSRIVLSAVAGSGKTETVAARARRVAGQGKRVLVSCFTRSARATLTARLKAFSGVEVRTVHSLAFEAVGAVLDEDMWSLGTGESLAKEVVSHSPVKYGEVLRMEAFDVNGAPLPAEFGSSLFDTAVGDFNDTKAREELLTHNDLVLLAYVFPPVRKYDEIIVDEAQDLTSSEWAFVQRLLAPGGSLVLVGDPGQAIFGWAGVDPDFLVSQAGFKGMNLTKSYRVPQGLCNFANLFRKTPMYGVGSGGSITLVKKKDFGSLLGSSAAVIAPRNSDLNHLRSFVDPDVAQKVPFLSVHKAKGGEWHDVFVYGLNYEDYADKQYFNNLWYVAATRSLKNIYLLEG